MGTIASQITSLTIVYSTVYSDADQRKHQSSASLAFVRGIHRGPVNSPHKWPVTRKMFSFYDVIMIYYSYVISAPWHFRGLASRLFVQQLVQCNNKYLLSSSSLVITVRYDNLRCHQWQQSCQIDSLLFSVTEKPPVTIKLRSLEIVSNVMASSCSLTMYIELHLYLSAIVLITWQILQGASQIFWWPKINRSEGIYIRMCIGWASVGDVHH